MSAMLDTLLVIAGAVPRQGNERNELNEQTHPAKGVNSFNSFNSSTPHKKNTQAAQPYRQVWEQKNKGGKTVPTLGGEPDRPKGLADETPEREVLHGGNERNELNEQTSREELEERAAIVEFDAGVPREWAEGFAKLCCMPKPGGIGPRQWQQLIDNAGTFIDRFASQAASLGWDTASVFGCHPVAPTARLDLAGLVFLIGDGEIIAITTMTAKIRTAGGSVLTYQRHEPTLGEPHVAIWVL